MTSNVYLLDTIVDCLGNTSGMLYGYHSESGNRRCTIICSLEPRPGLVPVASLEAGQDLPHLIPDGNGGWSLQAQDRGSVPTTILRFSHDYGMRMAGVVDATILGSKRALIVGTGSIGSPLALQLARAGVGALTLCDPDRVELPNLCRSGFSVDQLGMPKVEALAELVLRANPAINLQLLDRSLSDALDEDPNAVGMPDIIIAAATNAVGFHIAAEYHRAVPIIFPALHRRAASGEIFVSSGMSSACFACYRGLVHRAAESTAQSWNYDSAEGELQAEPGLGADIGHVVTIAASIAINILTGADGRTFGGNLLLVGNRAGGMFDDAYSSRWANVMRDDACPYHSPIGEWRGGHSALDSLPEAAQ